MSTTEMIEPKRQNLLRSTSLVSLLTFFSRMMGFVRDMIIAQLFGAQAGIDAFFVAFRIPNFMRRLFAEGAFSQAFVPVLAEYQKTRDHEDVRSFLAQIAGYLSSILSLVTLVGVIGAPVIIYLFAPGYSEDPTRLTLATQMLRLTFPYLMLVSLTAMAGAVLNTYGYFGIPAFTPVLLNLSMIGAALYLCPELPVPVIGLAWGVLIAGIVQLLFQIPFLYQRRLLVKPTLLRKDDGVVRVVKLMIPALFGVSIAQLNLMVDTIFASYLKVGSVSWLYYTDRLTDFPLGVFGVAIATVILPHLSRRHSENSQKQFSSALDWGLRLLLLIGLPAALGLTVFSMPVIACCFGYGKFTVYDVWQTQKSLLALGAGVPAFMMVKVLASGFYAGQNIKTPVKVGAMAMVINSLLCAVFIWPLAHAGLALASTLAGYFNCLMLLILLIKRDIYVPSSGWIRYLWQLAFASLCLAVYLYLIQGSLEQWLGLAPQWRLALLMAEIVFSGVIYCGALLLVGVRPAQFRGHMREF